MWLQDGPSRLHGAGLQSEADGGPSPVSEPSTPSSRVRATAKAVRVAIAQQQLAVREYREALRLRPRDLDTRQKLVRAVKVLRRLEDALNVPKPHSLRRFLAHYNLSIRYWDLGKAPQAIEQAELACKELRSLGVPGGCADHNLRVMTQVQAEFRAQQRELQEGLKRSPEAVGLNYELGMHFFDKRMLVRAEDQLRKTRDRARALSALQLLEYDRQKRQLHKQASTAEFRIWSSAEAKKAEHMTKLLDDIADDLDYVAGLRNQWCVEEEAGKLDELQATGVRDSVRPRLLLCMHQRYSQDSRACDAWWMELCQRTDICLHTARR